MNAKDRFVDKIVGFNVTLALIGALIISIWVVVLFSEFIAQAPRIATFSTLIFILIGLGVHFAVLSGGNHLAAWAASAFIVLLALIKIFSLTSGPDVDLAAIAGMSVLIYNESVRLSFAQRRGTIVDQAIYFSSAISIVVVGFFAAIGVQVAKFGVSIQPTRIDGETSSQQNWWVLVSVITLILAMVAVLFVPTLRRQRQTAKRVHPGERIDPSTIDLPHTNQRS